MSAQRHELEFNSLCRQWVNAGYQIHPFYLDQIKEKWLTCLRRYTYMYGMRCMDSWRGNPQFEIRGSYRVLPGVALIIEEDLVGLWTRHMSKGLRSLHFFEIVDGVIMFGFAGRYEDGTFVAGKIILEPEKA
ncbi:MAG: hypothetical protein JST40_00615 [Armatimonadetes bacterium]|nr:hypothetical protein [Armatimonadota bacterium]